MSCLEIKGRQTLISQYTLIFYNNLDLLLKTVMLSISEIKKFFIDSFSDPVYQDGVLYFIIEELPNPRDSGIFKILCGTTQIALDAVTLDEPGVVIANELIGLHAATIRKYPYQKIEYVNIAPWAQEKIESRMARIGLKI